MAARDRRNSLSQMSAFRREMAEAATEETPMATPKIKKVFYLPPDYGFFPMLVGLGVVAVVVLFWPQEPHTAKWYAEHLDAARVAQTQCARLASAGTQLSERMKTECESVGNALHVINQRVP